MARILKITFVSLALVFFGLTSAFAAKSEIYTGFASNLAVSGYDSVAYFTNGSPVKGSKEFSTEYKSAVWRFESHENLDLFLADPEAYAPQYGGYCAWAVAEDYTAKGNPKFWTVYEGKLYLNYNAKVQEDWLVDIPGFIEKANANWPGVLD